MVTFVGPKNEDEKNLIKHTNTDPQSFLFFFFMRKDNISVKAIGQCFRRLSTTMCTISTS